MKQKCFKLKIKSVTDEGVFEGYASVTGNADSDNEVIDKGAFKRTLDGSKGVVPILWQHDRTMPIGWNKTAVEDGHGLAVTGELFIDTEIGKMALAFLKKGLELGGKPGLSIGFVVPKGGDYFKDGVRHFKEVGLKEYSIVTFPANERATVTGAKAEDFESSLAEAKVMQALYEERYQMSSALSDAVCDIMEDDSLDVAGKKTAITTSYTQYAAAMSDWYGRFIDSQQDEDDTDEKAGKVISNATKTMLDKATGHLMASQGHAKMAQSERTKALGVLGYLAAGGYANNDINKPNPVGGGKSDKSDPEILHSLLEMTRSVARSIKA